MAKEREWMQTEAPHLLAIEDPQVPGRDIGSGAFAILEVLPLQQRVMLKFSNICEHLIFTVLGAPCCFLVVERSMLWDCPDGNADGPNKLADQGYDPQRCGCRWGIEDFACLWKDPKTP